MQVSRIAVFVAFVTLVASAVPAFPQPDGPPIILPHAHLLVKCDLACDWKLDGEAAGHLDDGESTTVPLTLGQHLVEAVTMDGLDKAEQIIEVKNAEQKVALFKLLPVRSARVKADQPEPEPVTDTLVVQCDLACNWKLDGGAMGSIREASESNRIPVSLGQHRIEATTEDGLDKKNINFEAKSAGRTIALMIDLLSERAARLKAEEPIQDNAEEEQKKRDRYQQGMELFNQKKFREAKPLFEEACDNKISNACYVLSKMYLHALGVVLDYNRAFTLSTFSCNAGNLNGCNLLGILYKNGFGVAQDYTHSMALFTQTCDAGEIKGCSNLGLLFHEGKGTAKDDIRAIELLSKACDAEDETSCTYLGNMYHEGSGVAKDDSKALALYKQSCHAEDGLGCNNSGSMYAHGWGVAKDDLQATVFYTQSCMDENALGCANLGNCYRLGLGGEKDSGKARLFLDKSCAMGNQWGCDRLKELDAATPQSSRIGFNHTPSPNQPTGLTNVSTQHLMNGTDELPAGVYHVGRNIVAPYPIKTVDAEFSPEARRAKYQGVCVVSLIVDAQGNPQNPRVVRSLGMGLDEKAIEAVLKYKFHPAMKDGQTPVPVMVQIEVNFKLF